jgi:protein Xni
VTAKTLLVDGFNLIRRIYEARPDAEQEIDDVIQASKQSLGRGLKQHPATHACVVFDSHELTWRHHLYGDYKAGRKPTPSPLLDNLSRFEESFAELGVASLTVAGFEADDVIATLAVGLAAKNADAIILSTDKGFLQLLSNHIKVFNHFEQSELTHETVSSKYDVKVEQLTDYWAMAGDASNNIKGVLKVGKKTAAALLKQYAFLEDILRDDLAVATALKVQNHGEVALQCKQLVTLKTDVSLGINLKSLRLQK